MNLFLTYFQLWTMFGVFAPILSWVFSLLYIFETNFVILVSFIGIKDMWFLKTYAQKLFSLMRDVISFFVACFLCLLFLILGWLMPTIVSLKSQIINKKPWNQLQTSFHIRFFMNHTLIFYYFFPLNQFRNHLCCTKSKIKQRKRNIPFLTEVTDQKRWSYHQTNTSIFNFFLNPVV